MNRILLTKNISALLFWCVVMMGLQTNVWSQGTEDFEDQTALTASYADGSFTNLVSGVTWTYGHSRDQEFFGISGKGLMIRRASDSYLEATFPNGVGTFSFQAKKAFTGNAERQLQLLVNGVVKFTSPAFGTVSETTIYSFSVDINQAGPLTIRIKNIGGTTTNRQTTIDNISWTAAAPSIVAPSVTTSSVMNVTNTSATLGGNVTATGGADITDNGSVYSLTVNNSNPMIGGVDVTQITTSSPAIGTGTFSNATGSVLDANTQYTFKAYAINSEGTSYGSAENFYTLALVPGQPVVSNATTTTLDIAINDNSNPDATTFAILEAGGMYVQANGTLGASAVFQTAATWGLVTANGLNQGTEYTFSVIARNGDSVNTAASASASGTTLLNTSPTLFVNELESFGDVCVGDDVVRSFTFSAENLTSSNLVVSGPAGYSFSSTEMGIYSSTLNINTTPTMTDEMVYVKFSPVAAGNADGMIEINGGGLAGTYNVAAIAEGVITAATVVTSDSTNVTSIQVTLSGSFEAGCYEVTEYGFAYSTANGFATGTEVASTNQVAGEFTATIIGLEPNTTYFYKAFATDGTTLIYGNQRSFTTEGIATPVAEDATDITSSGFTANWTGVPGATGYRIDVSTNPDFGENVIGTTTVENFNNIGTSSTAYGIINWTGVDGVTWVAENSRNDQTLNGKAITLRNQAGAFLSSGVISGGVSNVTFNVQQKFAGSGGELTVEVLSGAGFATITNLGQFSYTTTVSTFNSGALNISGDFKIRLTNNTSARPAIDDLSFTRLSSFTPSFVIEDADAGNGTSFIVTGLNENTTYYYRVRATSTNSVSGNSNTIMVTTIGAPSTFGSIAIDGAVCEGSDATFTITGLLANSTNTIEYNIGGGATASVAGIVADENGVGTFTMSFTYAQNGLVFTVTSVERTDISSSVVAVTDNNTVTLEINELLTMYADADGDGFGDVNVMMTSCEMLEGYVLNSDDCDDSNADVNPDATEILYNGIDDNCDGTIDEGNQITTQVVASQCGSTLSNIYSIINITPNSAATAYRFRVVDISDNSTQYLVSTLPSFRITDLASFAYDKSYTVSVEIQRAGVWLGYYGAECRINTPSLANGLTFVQCGATINIYKGINTGVVQGATGYRFRITNVTNPGGANEVQVIDTTVPYFQLTSLASYEYNTTYSVQVAIKTTGAYTAYGPACDISTLPWSALPLSIRQCGNTYTSIYKGINAGVIPNVSGYRFRFTNLATNVQEVITSAISYTSLSQLTTYVAGASYSVEVAVKTTEDFGPYGPACTINAPAAIASNGTIVSNADFKVVASPNPFSDTFAVNVSTTADSNVEVKVYDMIGKLLEVRSVQAGELEAQRLGNGYPSGVYNVIITQDQTVKTLKVIKR